MRKKILNFAAIAFVAALGLGAFVCNTNTARAAEEETAVFKMVEGAQVRMSDPSGIRFVTEVNAKYQEELADKYPEDIYDYVWGTNLKFTDANESSYDWDAATVDWKDESHWYTALVGIPETDYLTAITAESYVRIYDADDVLVYSDTVENAQTRSIAQTASLALNSGNYTNEEKLYAYTNAIPNTSLELDKESESVVAGTEIQLNANAQPAGYGVAWRSSDMSVATVDKNGKVTAINAGEAIITARLGNATDSYQLTVTPSAESQLVTEFYMKGTDANVYHQADFAHVKGVVSEDNFAYGKYDLGDGRTNATTMYATLSYEYMKTLFAANIVEIKFDVILSVADKKLQINARDLTEGVSYTTSSAEVNGKTYYVYTVTMERAYYQTLSKDITLRYTFGKDANNNTIGNVRSEFFFIDNLIAVEGEVIEEETKYDASQLIAGYSKTYEGSDQTLTGGLSLGDKKDLYGIKEMSKNVSATMWISLSSTYMQEMFKDTSVNSISFDVILEIDAKTMKIFRNSSSAVVTLANAASTDSMQVGEKTYYIYTLTITRKNYEDYGMNSNMNIRYNGGTAIPDAKNPNSPTSSYCFYVGNLQVKK